VLLEIKCFIGSDVGKKITEMADTIRIMNNMMRGMDEVMLCCVVLNK